MKNKSFIISGLSLLVGIFFFAGSTGLNIVIHHCLLCGHNKTEATLFLPPADHTDDCCKSSHEAYPFGKPPAFNETCCLLKVEKLKLTNYTPSEPVNLTFQGEALTIYYSNIILPSPGTINRQQHFSVFNKHGGRSVITLNCQLLT